MPSKPETKRSSDRPRVAENDPTLIVRNEGQRLLLQVTGSLAQIAKTVDVSKAAVLGWRQGKKVPNSSMRRRLAGAFAIPVAAWSSTPSDGEKAAATPPPIPPMPKNPLGTLEHCLALLWKIQTARDSPDLSPSERVKLADTEARILSLRHRLELKSDMLEDRIVRDHPRWQALKRAIARALVPYPVAAKAVADEIRRLQMM